jgi:hypothetical protein
LIVRARGVSEAGKHPIMAAVNGDGSKAAAGSGTPTDSSDARLAFIGSVLIGYKVEAQVSCGVLFSSGRARASSHNKRQGAASRRFES